MNSPSRINFSHIRACITPKVGTGLAGYPRKPTSNGIYDDLYLQILLLEDSRKKRLLLVCVDLIGFDLLFVRKMRAWIRRQDKNLDGAAIIFSATHTHCGPATFNVFPAAVGSICDEYMTFLERSIKNGIRHVLSSKLKQGSLNCGIGKCTLAVNRRLKVVEEKHGKKLVSYRMAPNLKGSTDPALGLLQVKGADEDILIINYACHPTTRGDYIISGDYPAAAARVLRASSYEKREVMFLQGAAGDLRVPTLNKGKTAFSRADEDDVIIFGNRIVKSVEVLLDKGLEKINANFRTSHKAFVLPYNKDVFIKVDTGKAPKKITDCRLKYESKDGVPLEWVIWQISKECTFLALPGEVCNDIGKKAKRISEVRYPFFLAYANGSPAYIPTDKIIKEGGYEGKDAMSFFGHHHPFKAGAEQILYENLHTAFTKLQSR